MEMIWLRDQFGLHITDDSGEKMTLPAPEPTMLPHHSLTQITPQFMTGMPIMPPAYEEMEPHNPMEVTNYMMMDGEFDTYDEEASPKYMSSASTQTMSQPTRKIKPVKHPGLKLKTPIAYRRDSDLSIIPIQKEGMAVCEKCGAIGVKHAFYTRERRFCSLECSRGQDPSRTQTHLIRPDIEDPNKIEPGISFEQTFEEDNEALLEQPFEELKPDLEMMDVDNLVSHQQEHKPPAKPLPPLPIIPPIPPDDPPLPLKRKNAELANSYDWTTKLSEPTFMAAPVSCFKHAPLSDCWDNIIVGMKVEVENTDCENFSEDFPDSFWVATVLKISGYKAMLRYEGFGQDMTKDFWVNLCSAVVHPVGWCATRGKPLIPPKTIQDKYKDWKQFLVKRLTGARTLPSNFYTKVADSLRSRFKCGQTLEVVDKNRISQVKVATITKIVGKRLHISYYDADEDEEGFWCHEDSPLIHPVGWARRFGHSIDADEEYLQRCCGEHELLLEEDAGPELFSVPKVITFPLEGFGQPGEQFLEGMKLEAIDPLNLSSICVATVMTVLHEGYIMVRIDSYEADQTGADWFCYHASSPCIFPPGFCEMNSIPLTPPKGFEDDFDWDYYLRKTGAVAAPLSLFNCADMEVPPHSFRVGMRVEAADLMDPRLVCVGTVARVVGRLLKVHFDGWDDEYDQWLDCDSPDFYPVGWCELVAHNLEGPATPGSSSTSSGRKVKKKPKRRTKKVKAQPARRRGQDSVAVPTRRSSDRLLREPAPGTWPNTGRSESPKAESPIESEGAPSCESDMWQESAGPELSPVASTEPKSRTSSESMHHSSVSPSPVPQQTTSSSPTSSLGLPKERPATSYKNNMSASGKIIPRLVDSSGLGTAETGELMPEEWNVFDVAQFLRVNDCAAYCDSFSKKKIDGKTLLSLTKDQIMDLTCMKVGPSLKIHDLIQQLKIKVNPSKARLKTAFRKRL